VKYRHKVKEDNRPMGELISVNHWSVEGLSKSLRIKQEEIDTWLKLNKQYKMLKKK
jgi:hypothetical protein